MCYHAVLVTLKNVDIEPMGLWLFSFLPEASYDRSFWYDLPGAVSIDFMAKPIRVEATALGN